MSLNIFLLYNIYHVCFTCIDFYDLSIWGGCWFVVYIRRFVHKFLNVCPFDYTAVAGSGKVGPVNQVKHTSWVAIVTSTERPKSVRNRSVIKLFVLSSCPFDMCWCRGFCLRTGSDLFLFLLVRALILNKFSIRNDTGAVTLYYISCLCSHHIQHLHISHFWSSTQWYFTT